jgi:hypothetical protein
VRGGRQNARARPRPLNTPQFINDENFCPSRWLSYSSLIQLSSLATSMRRASSRRPSNERPSLGPRVYAGERGLSLDRRCATFFRTHKRYATIR